MKDNWRLQDALQSVMAQTHSVQNRVVQAAGKGSMSAETAKQCAALLRDAATRLEEAAK